MRMGNIFKSKYFISIVTLAIIVGLLISAISVIPNNATASEYPKYKSYMVEDFAPPVTGWTYYNSPSIRVNSSFGYYSDESLQLSFASGVVGYARYIDMPISYPFELSYYFNLSSINNNNAIELLSFNNVTVRSGLNLWAGTNISGDCWISHYNGTSYNLVKIDKNVWHQIYIVAANANSWKLTVDGIYISTITIPRSTAPITGLILGKTNSAGMATGVLYVDDIVISSGRGDYPGVNNAIITDARSLPSITTPILDGGNIYIPYMATHQLDTYIKSYQWETWSSARKIGDNPGYDYHAGPSIIRDNNGYLHSFYGSHNSPILYAKSAAPDDITTWIPQPSLDINGTYPFPLHDPTGDGIYILYRDNSWNWNITYSLDNGASWLDPYTVIIKQTNTFIYISTPVIYEYNSKTYIAISWVTDYGNGPRVLGDPFMREDLFYGLYCINDYKWYTYQNEYVASNINYENEYKFKIWESHGLRSETPILKIINNEPYITWQRITEDDTYKLSFIKLDGLHWTDIEDIEEFDIRPFIECGFTYNDGELSVIFSNPDTLEVVKYIRLNSNWYVDKILLNRTSLNFDCRFSTIKNVDGTDDMIIIYEAKHDYSDIYTNVKIWVYSSALGFITDGTDIVRYVRPSIEPFVDFEVLTKVIVFVLPIVLLGWYGGKYGAVIGLIAMSFITMSIFEHGVVIMICGCISGVIILLYNGDN